MTEINQRVAVSDGGIVFAQLLDESKPSNVAPYHNGALSALEVRVSDLEEAKQRLIAKGVDPVYYLDTPGGLTEYYMHQFHGVPLTISKWTPRAGSSRSAVRSLIRRRIAKHPLGG